MKNRKLAWYQKPFYLLNGIFAFLLLLTYTSYFISPEIISWVSILALGYPVILLINLFFVVFWLIQGKRNFLTSTLVIAIGYPFLLGAFQFSGNQQDVRNRKDALKIMTFNARSYTQYTRDGKDGLTVAIDSFLNAENPSILFLQENYDYHRTPHFNFPHQFIPGSERNQKFSLGILSKHSLINQEKISFGLDEGPYRHFLQADMVYHKDTFRLFCIHLMSNQFSNKDLEAINDVGNKNAEEVEKSTKDLISRLQRFGSIRAQQIDVITKAIDESPYPVILGGDFNEPPSSYPFQQVNKRLHDSFEEAGRGISPTYRTFPIPLRIDHVFYSEEEFSAWNYHVHKVDFSDHYPVSVVLIPSS